jgi:hypothetical protein
MKLSTQIIIVFGIVLVALLAIVVDSTPVKANQLSDFNYAIANPNNPRANVILNDLVYEFGTMDRLVTRMNADANLPAVFMATVLWNPATGNVEYTVN